MRLKALRLRSNVSTSDIMEELFFVAIFHYLDMLQALPALSRSCTEAACALRKPSAWCGAVTVRHYMLRDYKSRAQFIIWLWSVARNHVSHLGVWRALNSMQVDHIESYSMILSAILMTKCSHDLYYWGLISVPSSRGLTSRRLRKEIVRSEGNKSVKVFQYEYSLVLTDGPVQGGPFRFMFEAAELLDVELNLGYIPWPIECSQFGTSQFGNGPGDALHNVAVAYLSVDFGGGDIDALFLREPGRGGTRWKAALQLDMSNDGRLHIQNLSTNKEFPQEQIKVCPLSTTHSPTGAFGIFCTHNSNLLKMTLLDSL